MKRALIAILAVSCLTNGACSKNNPTSEVPAVQPQTTVDPIESTDAPAAAAELAQNDPFGAIPEPAELEPALPVPGPSAVAEDFDAPPPPPQGSVSALEVMGSVERVLRGTIGGDGAESESKGSIFRSIGRALAKGAQEAASSNHAGSND